MTIGSQAEYARSRGVSRGVVTEEKKAGRLVFTDDGLVDFEASDRRRKETASRDDVKDRHARNKGEKVAEQSAAGNSYQEAKALKEKYLALQAKADYEKSIGELVDRADVERDWVEVATIMRSSLERIPDFLSADLAAESDPNRIHAILVEYIESVLEQAANKIKKLK